jgi:hypothetical protein
MKLDAAPTIYSFIIRFVVEETDPEREISSSYHGEIRHIQSAEELKFNDWNEAVEFMRRFVPVDDLNAKPSSSK